MALLPHVARPQYLPQLRGLHLPIRVPRTQITTNLTCFTDTTPGSTHHDSIMSFYHLFSAHRPHNWSPQIPASLPKTRHNELTQQTEATPLKTQDTKTRNPPQHGKPLTVPSHLHFDERNTEESSTPIGGRNDFRPRHLGMRYSHTIHSPERAGSVNRRKLH